MRRIWRERDEVELGRPSALSAIAIAVGYHTLCLVGEAVFKVNPEFILKRMAV